MTKATADLGLGPRRAALAAITAVEVDGAWSNLAVPRAVGSLTTARDRALATHLAYETLRRQGTLEWQLGQVLNRPIGRVEPLVARLLRLGAVQLLHSRIPARAAVDTTVRLVRECLPRRRAEGAARFVNGVLRGLDRAAPRLPVPKLDDDPVQHLALTTAHPAWIVDELLNRMPAAAVSALLHGDNATVGTTLRVDDDRTRVMNELASADVDVVEGAHPQSIRVRGIDPASLDPVTDGRAVIQDEASTTVVDRAAVQPGDRVLDLCAGPGGKAGLAARRAGAYGRVTAVELHEHRAALVRATAERLGVAIDVHVADGRRLPASLEHFDVVLVDAPCSGLGVGRRRPELRWRRRPDELAGLHRLQLELLTSGARRCRPGGTLVYAACTWTAMETVAVAETFDRDHAAFLTVSREQLLPHANGTDGMFVAVWRRAES